MQSYCSTFQCCKGKKYRSTNLSIPAAAMCSIIYVCWYFIVIVLSLSLCARQTSSMGLHFHFEQKNCVVFVIVVIMCELLLSRYKRSVFLFRFFCSSCTFAFFLLNFPPHNKCRRFELKRASDEQTNERANRTKLLTERPPSNQFNRYIEK